MPYGQKPKPKKAAAAKTAPAKSKPKAAAKKNPVGAITTTYQRGYLPFAREYRAKLPYCEDTFIAADSTTQTSAIGYTYRANSVFDPRFQVGGHQPLQYDILAQCYERVWVHGAAVTLTFSNPSTDGMWVGYRVRNSTNSVTSAGKTLSYIREMRDSVCEPLNNSGSQVKTFTFYVPCAKVLGLTAAQYSDVQYSETMSAASDPNPLIEPYALSTSATTLSDTVRFSVKITYYCQFTGSITQTQS